MIITPLCICFPEVKDRLLKFEWFVDCSWTLEIVLNFLVAQHETDTISIIIARNFNSGIFIIDSISTFPPMITQEKSIGANMFKFLRVIHFKDMFRPFHLLLEFAMYDSDTKKISRMQEFTILISSVMLLAHFFAIGWIKIGRQDCIEDNF